MQTNIDLQDAPALVLEGGGMRGARVAGFVSESGRMGLFRKFSRVYSVSAGTYTASLAVAGQFDVIEHIWKHLLDGRKFLSMINLLAAKPIMNLDYLIQILTSGETALDVAAIQEASQDLFFVATNYQTGRAEYFNAKKVDRCDAMRASSALPWIYHKPIQINGDRYIDGCFSDPIPIIKAIADGFRNILVVRSKLEERVEPVNGLAAWLQFPMARQIREAVKQKVQRYDRAFQKLACPPDGVRIYTVRPENLKVTNFSTDKSLLIEAVEQGKQDARAHLPLAMDYFFNQK